MMNSDKIMWKYTLDKIIKLKHLIIGFSLVKMINLLHIAGKGLFVFGILIPNN